MRKGIVALVAAALIGVPGLAAAQGFGVAGRAGTLGIGAEAALGLSGSLVARGGIGLMPFEIDPTSFWEPGTDVDATLELPGTWYNLGLDLYLGGSFRIGGGMLYKPDDPTLTGTLVGSASIEIGGQTYTASQVTKVTGTLESKKSAPYALIGFGKHTSTGIGLFLDLGVAMLGEPTVQLVAEGDSNVVNSNEFKTRLDAEERSLEDDAGSYLKFWPILNIGLRIGLGN